MILIGENINGSIHAVADAIAARNEAFLADLARRQEKQGATYLDCCASVKTDEAECMQWMTECMEAAASLPLCLDSTDPEVLVQTAVHCKRPGIFNSVSGAGTSAERIFRMMTEEPWKKWSVILLLMDEMGIPDKAEGRIAILERLMEMANGFGIEPERIFVDPVVEMVCLSDEGSRVALEVIRETRRRYPKVHITAAVSNVAWQLPRKTNVQAGFAVLAMEAGADTLMMNPLNRELMGVVCAAEALLGRDEFCLNYIEEYRKERF